MTRKAMTGEAVEAATMETTTVNANETAMETTASAMEPSATPATVAES